MNLLDLALVALAAVAAVGGYRLGFLRRAGSWIGAAIGIYVGIQLVHPAVAAVEGSDPLTTLAVALLVVAGSAMVGQGVGFAVGGALGRRIPQGGRSLDRGAGAVAGVAGLLVLVWLLLPALGDIPGEVSRLTRTSRVVQAIDRLAPAPPDSVRALRALVGDTPFPEVFTNLRPTPEVGPPPETIPIPQQVQQRVAESVVAVEAVACDQLQEGSGFVAQGDLVVTNAHVVAGSREVQVLRSDGERLTATVVAFDDDRDLALLSVPGLGRPPLPIASAPPGTQGAVFGFPLGQDTLRVAPAAVSDEVDAIGRDIYGRDQVRRQVLILSADLAQGDSGAALADAGGRVVGVVFAIAPDRPQTAYALDDAELAAILNAPRSPAADTGPCI